MVWTNPVTGLNLTSILITNLFGLVLMLILLLSRGWMTRVKSRESKLLFIMILTVIVGCIVEPLAFILDGIPGKFNHIMVFISNTILFSLNVIIGPCYVTLITSHINKTLSRLQIIVVFTLCTLETLMLFINIFVPMIFIVGSDNIYVRKPFFWVYTAVEAGMMLYGLLVFFIARGKGKLLKFFPAWQFFIPVFVGLLLQGLMYGVSVIWPSVGIAVCSTVLCLQNENIFLDKLTGVFNRYYLDELKKGFKSERKGTIGAMMLDMNGFKHINDTYSHEEGDIALKNVSSILKKVIASNGTIVRFAGDEFVILVKTSAKAELDEYKDRINKAFDEYNSTSGKPYKLSVAIGTDLYDLKQGDVSTLLNSIDSLMYNDKADYYKKHDRRGSSDNR